MEDEEDLAGAVVGVEAGVEVVVAGEEGGEVRKRTRSGFQSPSLVVW